MLKQRVMTALILIPIFVFLVLKLSSSAFCVLTALLVLWGAWEWSLFLGVARFPQCFIYPGLMLLALIASLYLPVMWILTAALAAWIIGSLLVMIYPKERRWGKSIFWRGLMGFLVLIPCWTAINMLHSNQHGPFILLYLFVLIWGADIGAYFAGNRWGKHKLCPLVSPNKSWEGLVGALVVTTLLSLGMTWGLLGLPFAMGLLVLLLSLITVLFSVMGDLFESMLKRNVGLKDSGQLLPGHGGLLDRIDSLTAAAPIFVLGKIELVNSIMRLGNHH